MKANYDELRRKMIRETEEYLERRLGASADGATTEPGAGLLEQPIEGLAPPPVFDRLSPLQKVCPSDFMSDQSCAKSA